jgi:Cytochrome P450
MPGRFTYPDDRVGAPRSGVNHRGRRPQSRSGHRLGNPGKEGRFVRKRGRIDELLYSEIALRRSEFGAIAALEDSAGAATAITWAIERLVRNPRVLRQLLSSLENGDNIYLEAVIKETLRVRPVTQGIPRVLAQEAEIDGWALPAGTNIGFAIGVLHRDPAHSRARGIPAGAVPGRQRPRYRSLVAIRRRSTALPRCQLGHARDARGPRDHPAQCAPGPGSARSREAHRSSRDNHPRSRWPSDRHRALPLDGNVKQKVKYSPTHDILSWLRNCWDDPRQSLRRRR